MTENIKYKFLEPDELMARLKNKESFILIDTLTGTHFEKVHLPGALNACVFEVTFLEQVKAIENSKQAQIVLYGSSSRSRDALTAAEKLRNEGYEDISVLNGGIEAWRAQKFQVQGRQTDVSETETVLRLDDGKFSVDTDQSIIEWCGRNPNNKHFGTVGIRRGEIEVNNAILTGRFDIDMDSIDNINLKGDELHPVLTSHLKSDDFFFVKMFPTAILSISEGVPVGTPHLSIPDYDFKATLQLRGVEADLAFQATVSKTKNGGIAAEAHFDIDRTRWKVIYGSARFFENLGMHLVFDPISFQVKIVTTVSES